MSLRELKRWLTRARKRYWAALKTDAPKEVVKRRRRVKNRLAERYRRRREQNNTLPTSPGVPYWGGSDVVLREVVEPIARAAGFSPNSAKRWETYGNPGSDHYAGNTLASARDFPTATNYTLAQRIRNALDGGTHSDYANFYFTYKGVTFRGQIIAATHGTGPHLHVGIRRA